MMLTDASISELWDEAQKVSALPAWRDNTAQGQEGIIRFARFVEIRTVEYITSTRGLRARQLGEWIRIVFGRNLQGSENAKAFLEGLGFPVPRAFDVTDPDLDAPDGAVVDGYRRSGDRWIPVY